MIDRALNRALLARQGLLEPIAGPPAEVVAAVGALQMQYWPALGPALWSRSRDLTPDAPFYAHADGSLVTAKLLRGTIHTVPAALYPAYAEVTVGSKIGVWRTREEPGPQVRDLVDALAERAATPRKPAELTELTESWVAAHPGVFTDEELRREREFGWLPVFNRARFLRAPTDGRWGPKTPSLYVAGPRDAPDDALETVLTCHLRAFGPAAAEDAASWIAWNIGPVKAALDRMPLERFTDESGRTLYDLPDAPRPHPDTPAPVRLLPWFDSTLLAYAPKRRTRILPVPLADIVYKRINGQLKPTYTVDGMVAGMWGLSEAKGVATLTLTPLAALPAAARGELLDQAERLAAFCKPGAKRHEVVFAH